MNIWFISDTHFFHGNILKFTGDDGLRIRPEFNSLEEMHEIIVQNWNAVVRPDDHVWHLGDVSFGSFGDAFHRLMRRLMGKKRLVIGNHDPLKGQKYDALAQHFEKIAWWRPLRDLKFPGVASHIPLRPDQMRGGECNIHGHIHQRVMKEPCYYNVSVERTNYTPVNLDEIRKAFS